MVYYQQPVYQQMPLNYPQGQPPGQFQQQAQAQAQANVMPEPPTVLSTKDHLYLKDALSWELTVMKKCRHFGQEAADPEIKAAFDRLGAMHQQHYQLLLSHLNPTTNAQYYTPQTQS